MFKEQPRFFEVRKDINSWKYETMFFVNFLTKNIALQISKIHGSILSRLSYIWNEVSG